LATANATVVIDGKSLEPYSLYLSQSANWHHEFEIKVRSEKVEGEYSISIDNSVAYIGKEVEINIDREGGQLHFIGIVTSINIERVLAVNNLIVFRGYSPTFLLEDGPGTQTFAEKGIKDIVNEIVSTYPANLMNLKVSPAYKSAIPYMVRYKETHYEFLSRLADAYGEWFFYNGKSIVFGEMPNADGIDLTMGENLNAFSYGVQIRPSKFTYQYYNYQDNQPVEYKSASFNPGWLDNYGKKSLKVADDIFPSEPLYPTAFEANANGQLKHMANVRRSAIMSDATTFNGESYHPGLTIGANIGVHVINKINNQSVKAFIERFRVVGVTHHLDAHKNYFNDFQAIPLSVVSPPLNPHVVKPEAESQVAVVKDNNDPDKMGRIRVQFKWQQGEDMTPWIRVVSSSASGDRGMYFVPEIGDEIYADFEQGNPDRPFMMGAHYHGKASPEFHHPDNNLKSIKTRSGHTILLNDEDGKENITIIDKVGNKIFMDTKEKSITLTALETITFNCKDMIMNVERNMDLKVGKTMEIDIGDDQISSIGANCFTEVGVDYELSAKNGMQSFSKGMGISVDGNFNLNANGNSIRANKEIIMNAENIKLNADSKLITNGFKEARHEGNKMIILSEGKMIVKGGATTYVKGSQVKIQG